MRPTRWTVLPAVVLALILAACGGATSAPADETDAPAATDAGDAPATDEGTMPTAGDGVNVHVVVDSGDLAGTYDATGEKVDCNLSDTGSGATLLDMDATDGVYSFTFSSAEGGSDPAMFLFDVGFAQGTSFNEDPLSDFPSLGFTTIQGAVSGEGTAHLTDNGDTISWSLDGTTEEGAHLAGTITCGPVDRR